MTVRAARALRALLLTVTVVFSVLAHHELMSGADTASPFVMAMPAPSVMAMPASMSGQHGAVAAIPAEPSVAAPQAAASHAMGCGGAAAMCTAAGVAHPPAPAALPSAAVLDQPALPRGHVHPLPPGTGPPEPGGVSSVLRV